MAIQNAARVQWPPQRASNKLMPKKMKKMAIPEYAIGRLVEKGDQGSYSGCPHDCLVKCV